MRQPLTIAVAQPRCVPLDVESNARAHAEAVREAAARVVVFPEMSLTGYEFEAPPVAPDDRRLQPLVEACRACGSVALAGAPAAADAGGSHIAMLAVDGDGARIAYRKVWLGGTEPRCFVPGPAPAVLDVDGWRLGLAICKDTGVVRHAADTAALGIDAYVSGVLELEEDAAIPEERARRVAHDHGVWVAIASFAGPTGEGYGRTAGGSGIWSPDGAEIARAGSEPGTWARATLA